MNGFRLSSSSSLLPGGLRPNGRGDRIQVVYDRLREQIIRGTLQPGTRIVETDVAARLGVSRTPVRAALQRLETEGYLFATGGAQSRMCVAPLTREDAAELFSIVAEIECLAVSRVAGDEPELRRLVVRRLRNLNELLRSAARSRGADLGRAFEVDRSFHDAIMASGAGPRLAALHATIKPQIERYSRIYVHALADEVARSADEHEQVIRAIEEGDAAAAAEATRRNWHNATARLGRVIENVGELGTA